MNIIIITQNEPFYLSENLNYLLSILDKDVKVVGCVVNDVSPFGKEESFLSKVLKTYKIFGLSFFIYYSCKFLYSKFFKKSLKSFLISQKIPIIKINENINSHKSLKKIKSYNPDLLVSILGNQIFKTNLINLAPKGCINLHTSLLPKYRGLMPTFWVLKNNEDYTGISVFFVDEGIDSGPIIVQRKVKIIKKNQADLIMKTKKIGMECIAEAILLIKDNLVKLKPNDKNQKSYYSFPKREDVIEFKKNNVFF
tara:strand:- start:47 stop:805 length:759 start_codon:yes stop_codon:yes gene_type:complete